MIMCLHWSKIKHNNLFYLLTKYGAQISGDSDTYSI